MNLWLQSKKQAEKIENLCNSINSNRFSFASSCVPIAVHTKHNANNFGGYLNLRFPLQRPLNSLFPETDGSSWAFSDAMNSVGNFQNSRKTWTVVDPLSPTGGPLSNNYDYCIFRTCLLNRLYRRYSSSDRASREIIVIIAKNCFVHF